MSLFNSNVKRMLRVSEKLLERPLTWLAAVWLRRLRARLRALACWLAPSPIASIRLFGLKPLVRVWVRGAKARAVRLERNGL